MDLNAKLQIRPGMSIQTFLLPDEVSLPTDSGAGQAADVVVVFAVNAAALASTAEPAWQAARDDRIAWICYPKAKQLGTDLNRDILARSAPEHGVRPVRQVAIDDTWSALRFRPDA